MSQLGIKFEAKDLCKPRSGPAYIDLCLKLCIAIEYLTKRIFNNSLEYYMLV